MRFLCTAQVFVCAGFFENRLVTNLIDSKMEDVMNQSSHYNLKFRSISILSQQNPRAS